MNAFNHWMYRMTRSIIAVGIVLTLGCGSGFCDEIYTWTDENGVKHFSNAPPGDAENAHVQFKEYQSQPQPNVDSNVDTGSEAEAEPTEMDALLREIDEENQRAEEEERRKAAEAKKNQPPSQADRIQAEKEKLMNTIADLEQKPLEYFGSQRNKIRSIGYYKYRLEALAQDPEKYFKEPQSFEGNVKEESTP